MPTVRSRVDACPGALSTHRADDGELARVRLPGGQLTAAQLRVLAAAADDLGDGELHLTSRGNLQLRAVRAPGELAQRLAAAGLLPSATHERVRNILASPLPRPLDVRPLAHDLDRAVCGRPLLAKLPGRFLFAVDSGVGDVAGEDADVCWRAVDRSVGALLLGGSDTGVLIPLPHAVDALVVAATAFLDVRGTGERAAWRVRELPRDAVDRVLAAVCCERRFQCSQRGESVVRNTTAAAPPRANAPETGPPQPGVHGTAVVAAPPLGVLTAGQARALADLAPDGLAVTPWRTVVLAADTEAVRQTGLIVDPDAPAVAVSACIGRPGCAKSRADVRADATRAMAALTGQRTRRAHIVGCERRCGRPRGDAADVLAEDGGYRVDGAWVAVDQLADSLRWKENR